MFMGIIITIMRETFLNTIILPVKTDFKLYFDFYSAYGRFYVCFPHLFGLFAESNNSVGIYYIRRMYRKMFG